MKSAYLLAGMPISFWHFSYAEQVIQGKSGYIENSISWYNVSALELKESEYIHKLIWLGGEAHESADRGFHQWIQ